MTTLRHEADCNGGDFEVRMHGPAEREGPENFATRRSAKWIERFAAGAAGDFPPCNFLSPRFISSDVSRFRCSRVLREILRSRGNILPTGTYYLRLFTYSYTNVYLDLDSPRLL